MTTSDMKLESASIQTFTPTRAKHIIAATDAVDGYNFRPQKGFIEQRNTDTGINSHVRKLSDLMKRGLWNWRDAAPIRLSSDGQLCSDGLHRLNACVHSGVDLTALVLTGDEWTAGLHTDKGKSRTLAQFLQSRKIKSAGTTAAVLRMVRVRQIAVDRGVSGSLSYLMCYVQDDDVIDFYEKYTDIITDAVSHSNCARSRYLNNTGYATYVVETRIAHGDEVTFDLRSRMETEVDRLPTNDPFRSMIKAAQKYNAVSHRNLPAFETFSSIHKAFTTHLAGGEIISWRWPSTPLKHVALGISTDRAA